MRARRTTTEAGLGNEHQRRRRETPVPWGSLCPLGCGQPLVPGQRLQFDHATPRALGGTGEDSRWVHGRCNEAAGARLGNRLRARRATPRRNGQRWA